MKIYVVTQGSYSDYHIITATLDRDVAEAVAKRFSKEYDEAEVEEYEDAELLLKPRWIVSFSEDGSAEVKSHPFVYYDTDTSCRVYMPFGTATVKVELVADDEESAIKIAAEKRAAYLAEKNGLV